MEESDPSHQLDYEMNSKFIFENKEVFSGGKNLTDFFDKIKDDVRRSWIDYMVADIKSFSSSAQSIFQNIYTDEDSLRRLLRHEKFRDFELLKFSGETGLWLEILDGISNRELSTIRYAREVLSSLSNDEIANFSLSRAEINLFLNIAEITQQFIDSAYLKQINLEDAPGAKVPGPQAKVPGYEFLYNENTPYSEVFSEMQELSTGLSTISSQIREGVVSGELQPSYTQLSEYLDALSSAYTSKETNPILINRVWRDIDARYVNLVMSGCPIILTPWGFISEGHHIGIELMTTINLGTKSTLHASSLEYNSLVKDFMSEYDSSFTPLPFVHQYVFTRNGINLPWSGTAAAGDKFVVFYDNENENFSRNLYRQYYEEFIAGHTNEERFIYVRGVNTVAHEAGHMPRMLDEALYKKMGVRINTNKLDEAKADCMSIFLYLKLISQKGSDIDPDEYLEQYIIDYIDEMRNARTHKNDDTGIVWYDFSARLILHRLFSCGAIVWSGEKIKIIDGFKGIVNLAELGKEIFDLYGLDNFDEQAVNEYVGNLENLISNNEDVQRFLSKILTIN